MTTFTPPADIPLRRQADARRAFTLTEVLIAASLSAFILAGVLSTFLLLGRTGLNAAAYAEMNSRLRVAIERFDRDVRLAADVRWQDERRLTLVFPAGRGPEITYAFVAADSSPASASGRFVRQAAGAAAETLVDGVAPDFAFRRYRLPSAQGADAPAANDLETRQLEIRLRALRPGAAAPSASQLALSARCALRNKSPGA